AAITARTLTAQGGRRGGTGGVSAIDPPFKPLYAPPAILWATRGSITMQDSNPGVTLRPAVADDADAILPHRGLVHFRERVPPRIPTTTVATIGATVVGFVTVHDDEAEQVYVAASARGGGVANMLLRHAEQVIAERFDTAWLAVVA